MTRTMLPFLRALYRFLASLKLAVLLLVMLMAVLAAATYYESVYDARTAQHLVYGSAWFAGFLFLLGVNVFCAAAVRYPWKFHQVGFLVTHSGILVILAGSFVTMLWGVDGQMALTEGQSGSTVALDRPVLRVLQGGTARELDAEFRWDPPREGHEFRVPLAGGVTAVVDRYYHQAAEEVEYLPGDGPPAVQVRLEGQRASVRQWLTPASGTLALGPARLRFRQAASDEQVRAFLEARPGAGRGQLQVLVKGEPQALDVSSLGTEPASLPQGHTVRLLRYLPHAVVREDRLVSLDDDPVNPAIEVEFQDREGNSETWLFLAAMPDLASRSGRRGKPLDVRGLYTFAPEEPSKSSLDLVLAPDGRVHYRLGSGRTGVAEPGRELATGWMDFRFRLDRVLPGAVAETRFRELELANGQEGPGEAIRLRFEGALDPSPRWLRPGDGVEVQPASGAPFQVAYGRRSVDVGFQVRLAKFEVGYDPGTRNPASYRSTVEVEGLDGPQVIQMNEPLKRNGFTFFQSSFQEAEGQPTVSIFSVARDPGIGLKYLGSLMLVLGVATHFYLRPYLIRRAHEAAVARARVEEDPREA